MLESQRNPNLLKFKNGLTVSDVARPDETHDLNSFSMKYAAPVRKVTTFGRPFKEKRLNSDQAAAVILVCLDLLESDEYKLMEFFYPVMLCDLLIPSLKLVKADALAMEIQKVGEFVYNAPFEKIRTMKIAFSGDEVAAARGRLFGNSGERILPKLRIGIHNDLCAPLLKALEPRALKMKPTKALKADAFSLTVQATDKKESGSRVGAPFALLKNEKWPTIGSTPLLPAVQLHPKDVPAALAKRLGGMLFQLFLSSNSDDWARYYEKGIPALARLIPLDQLGSTDAAVLPQSLAKEISANKALKFGAIQKWKTIKDQSLKPASGDKLLGFAYTEQGLGIFACAKCKKPMDLLLQLHQEPGAESHLPEISAAEGSIYVFQCKSHLAEFIVTFEA